MSMCERTSEGLQIQMSCMVVLCVWNIRTGYDQKDGMTSTQTVVLFFFLQQAILAS